MAPVTGINVLTNSIVKIIKKHIFKVKIVFTILYDNILDSGYDRRFLKNHILEFRVPQTYPK